MKRTCILVLGAGRSGTSALTRILSLLGADLATNLFEPKADNPTGFWESRDHVALNDELLRKLKLRWDLPLKARWDLLDTASSVRYRDRIVELLRRDFESSCLFVVKDPRLCRVLPIWRSALEQFDAQPRCVIIVRHPLEVAASLARRGLMPLHSGILLWLRSVLEAECESRNLNRLFVTYEQLLNDWRAVALRISQALNLEWPRDAAEVASEIDAFLQRGMRHHIVGEAISNEIQAAEPIAAIHTIYRAACAAARDETVDISAAFDKFPTSLLETKRFISELQRLLEVSDLASELVDMRGSLKSWPAAAVREKHPFGNRLRRVLAALKKFPARHVKSDSRPTNLFSE